MRAALPPFPAVSICSFNILAPCYKKLPASAATPLRFESELPEVWRQRNGHIIRDIDSLNAGIVWYT